MLTGKLTLIALFLYAESDDIPLHTWSVIPFLHYHKLFGPSNLQHLHFLGLVLYFLLSHIKLFFFHISIYCSM